MKVRPTTRSERFVIGGLAIFVLGLFAGLADNAPADPVTKTVTKTVTKIVKVPGPTKTVTAPGPTKTITKTQRVTPRSCVAALDEVGRLSTEMGKVTNLTIGYINLVSDAYKAGVLGTGLGDVTSKMDTLNGRMSGINDRTTGIVHRYARDAAACRS